MFEFNKHAFIYYKWDNHKFLVGNKFISPFDSVDYDVKRAFYARDIYESRLH